MHPDIGNIDPHFADIADRTARVGDKAQAVVDEIRQMQRDGLIIDGSLDKKVKSLYDFLKAAINNMPAYSNVIDRFLLKDQKG